MHEAGCTYIMASRSHTLYIGVTGNLLRRVFHRQTGIFAFWTLAPAENPPP